MFTHISAHTHAFVHAHKRAHTHMFTHKSTHKHTRAHTHKQTHSHACAHHKHTRANTHMHKLSSTCVRSHTHTHTKAYASHIHCAQMNPILQLGKEENHITKAQILSQMRNMGGWGHEPGVSTSRIAPLWPCQTNKSILTHRLRQRLPCQRVRVS